jgi:C-terminal processing protease CtpA/Prc
MVRSDRIGARRTGRTRLACAALAGVALLSLAAAGAAAAQSSGGGYMGVQLQDLDQELRDSYGYRGPGGVLIADVADGSPADRGGLQRGDILIRFEGNTMDSSEELSGAVRRCRPGDRVALSVWRGGREVPLRVELGGREDATVERRIVRVYEDEDAPEAPAPPKAPKAPKAPKHMELRWHDGESGEPIVIPMPDADEIRRQIEAVTTSRPRLGVELQDLDEELGEYFERPDGRGVLVTRVLKDTPAARAGMKAGDVINELDGESVDDAAELRGALAEHDAGAARITVLRRGQRQTLTAQLEESAAPQAWRGGGAPRVMVRRYGPESRPELEKEMQELRREMDELRRELEALRATAPKKGSSR